MRMVFAFSPICQKIFVSNSSCIPFQNLKFSIQEVYSFIIFEVNVCLVQRSQFHGEFCCFLG